MNHDTDQIRSWSELRKRLEDNTELAADGCLLYPDTSIQVRLSGGRVAHVSVARVAWMLAHHTDHLGTDDYAVHICRFGTNPPVLGTVCCVNPEHIRKGTFEDVRRMIEVRRRDHVLQEVRR